MMLPTVNIKICLVFYIVALLPGTLKSNRRNNLLSVPIQNVHFHCVTNANAHFLI